MSYHRYENECFVLSSAPEKEANRTYALFSKDLGLIYAKAQGVSMPSSKLRGSLEPIAKTKVSLIKGKEVWRLVGAEESISLWQQFKNNREELFLFTRLSNLIKRMIVSEENHLGVYQILEECFEALFLKNTAEKLTALELVAVSRILHNLGYLTLKEEYKPFFNVSLKEIESEIILNKKKDLIIDINRALKESHL
ncbi:MAG: recombination protein O N-terminal domain-containing protein [Patescibacteria group bacterium]